jgi:hypothetical protein
MSPATWSRDGLGCRTSATLLQASDLALYHGALGWILLPAVLGTRRAIPDSHSLREWTCRAPRRLTADSQSGTLVYTSGT